MTIKQPLLAMTLTLLSPFSLAMATQVIGETTCTNIESLALGKDSQVHSVPCPYQINVGGNQAHLIHQIEFKTPNGYMIATYDRRTVRHDESKERHTLTSSILLNGYSAEAITLDVQTLEPVAIATITSMHDDLYNDISSEASADPSTQFDTLLTCITPVGAENGADIGFCYPYTLFNL